MTTVHPSLHAVAAASAAVAAVSTTPVAPTSELNAIENKLSVYIHELQTHYEADIVKIKSTWSYVKANVGKLIASHVAAGGLGALATAVVKHLL